MRQYDVDFKGVGKDRPGQKSLKKEKSGELKTEMTMAETDNFLELLRNLKKWLSAHMRRTLNQESDSGFMSTCPI